MTAGRGSLGCLLFLLPTASSRLAQGSAGSQEGMNHGLQHTLCWAEGCSHVPMTMVGPSIFSGVLGNH